MGIRKCTAKGILIKTDSCKKRFEIDTISAKTYTANAKVTHPICVVLTVNMLISVSHLIIAEYG
jgi:hypothetical protein